MIRALPGVHPGKLNAYCPVKCYDVDAHACWPSSGGHPLGSRTRGLRCRSANSERRSIYCKLLPHYTLYTYGLHYSPVQARTNRRKETMMASADECQRQVIARCRILAARVFGALHAADGCIASRRCVDMRIVTVRTSG